MTFSIQIPGATGPTEVALEAGTSAIFVGANGGGKTRLAVLFEKSLGEAAHRISAHRALNLNPSVSKISEAEARNGLLKGGPSDGHHRLAHRWQQKEAVALLNDFDFLVQALFAEQTNTAYRNHSSARAGESRAFLPTKLETLAEIWDRLLPHRKLVLSGDDIQVSIAGVPETYSASQMSDGERSVFYMVGQVLIAAPNSLLIFDEPELHVHRSITGKLWDELEAARPDCAFVLITHDLEFAASRVAVKFVIRDYSPANGWTIDPVPEETGFSEDITTLILGSRRPILFSEGTGTSLDRAIYRACYPDWTVVARGGCEMVIHSVVTMRKNQAFTRVTCAGLVDADDYDEADVTKLGSLGVGVLPVSEIENLVVLPTVSRAIAEHEGFKDAELEDRLEKLKDAIFKLVEAPGAIDATVLSHCRRRIDRALKKIDLSDVTTTADLAQTYAHRTVGVDVTAIAAAAETYIRNAIQDRDLPALLTIYSNKGGLVNLAASHLKRTTKSEFENWLARVLRNDQAPHVKAAIQLVLPALQAR